MTIRFVFLQPVDEGHFSRRYNWLDYIPPFKGPVEMKQPCQRILRASPTTVRRSASQVKQPVVSHDFCHCALCFEDLIKLQVNFLLCLVSLVFNSTFYNISVISWLSVFYVEESRVSGKKQAVCRTVLTKLIT